MYGCCGMPEGAGEVSHAKEDMCWLLYRFPWVLSEKLISLISVKSIR